MVCMSRCSVWSDRGAKQKRGKCGGVVDGVDGVVDSAMLRGVEG